VGLIVLILLLRWEHKRSDASRSEALNQRAAAARATSAALSQSEASAPASSAITEDVPPLVEEPRVLTALDASMIQARLDKLGMAERLSHYDMEQMRRSVLDDCQRGKVGLWWEPLRGFVRGRAGRAGVNVVDARETSHTSLVRMLHALSKGIEETNVKLEHLVDRRGETMAADAWRVADGSAFISWEWGSRTGTIPMSAPDGKLDVVALVRALNGLFGWLGSPNRLVLFAPDGDSWCFVLSGAGSAEGAGSAPWGQLLMPSEAVEYISSVVPAVGAPAGP